MKIYTTTSYNNNFQARIKINKSNLKNITTSAGLGTTAIASLAAQTDFNLSCSNESTAAVKNTTPSYKGIPLDEPNYSETSAGVSGASVVMPLSMQLCASQGLETLNKISNNKLSKAYHYIYDTNQEDLASINSTTLNAGSALLSNNVPNNNENLIIYGTSVTPVASINTAKIVDSYKKTNDNNKKIPS